jgi:recombination protein RecA
MAEEKKKKDVPKTIEDFKKFLDKEYGKGTVIDPNAREAVKDVIPSSSFSFNLASGIGGWAKGKIYEVYADPSSGKSTLGYDAIANCQKKFGEDCLIIEKEFSYTKPYGSAMGINNEQLHIINPETQEDYYEQLIVALENNLFGVIVVDSLTSFAPKARHEGSQIMGLEARCNSYYMRLVINAIQKSNTCLIILQQTRLSIGGFGNPIVVSGGKAVEFYAHVRIWITRSEINKIDEENTMKFNFVKNKLANPFKVGVVTYKWGGGFDDASAIRQIALDAGIITLVKTTYVFPESDTKIIGKVKAAEFLRDNPEYVETVIKPLVTKYLESTYEVVEIEETTQE